MIKSFWLVETPKNELESQEFKDSYGTLCEDLRIEDSSVFFYPIFMFRRIIYAALLVFIYQFPVLQLWLILFFPAILVFFLIL